MNVIKTGIAVLATVCAFACAPMASADAISPSGSDYTFKFQGQCGDCKGYGTGTLQVQNYILGSALTDSNLVDFTYNSNLTSIDINPVSDDSFISEDILTGSINATPGYYTISVSQTFLGFPLSEFTSGSNGMWTAYQDEIDLDHGNNGLWNAPAGSAVPEPSTWLMMMLGIGGIGFAFRQAKRNHGFRFKDCFAA